MELSELPPHECPAIFYNEMLFLIILLFLALQKFYGFLAAFECSSFPSIRGEEGALGSIFPSNVKKFPVILPAARHGVLVP